MENFSCAVQRLLLALGAMSVAACGTTPSKVVSPKLNPAATAASAPAARYIVGGKPLNDPSQAVLLPVERTFAGVKAQVEAHYAAWSQESSNLALGVDGLGNTQFGGAVVGAIGAIASKVDVTKAGAAVAGGAGVWDSRYQLAVQAENYNLAAEAMYCIHQEVTRLPKGFWSATYVEDGDRVGSMKHDMAYYNMDGQSQEELVNAYNTLDGLFDSIAQSIRETTRRLTKAQRSLQLGTPSATDIQTALTNAAKEEPAAEANASFLQRGIRESASDTGQQPTAPEPKSIAQPAGKGGQKGSAIAIDPADLAKHNAAMKRYSRLFAGMSTARLNTKLTELRASAEISQADYKRALLLPSKLETCTKKIGG